MAHEASALKSQREPDSIYKMWVRLNNVVHAVNKSNSNINQINRDVKSIGNERNKLGFDLFPFKIYVLPDVYRQGNLTGQSWHTVRVRGGFVLTSTVGTASYVNGTDGFQNYAYANTYPTTNCDITLPTDSGSNPVWFWIENNTAVSSSSTYWLRYGSNPVSSSLGNPTPWVSFPNANANYIPVGLVDCYSSSSVNQALIRQFLTSDVLLSGGGGINYHFYNEQAAYNANTDIVFVDPSKPYTASFFANSSSAYPALCAGTFLCAINVPVSSSRSPYNVYYPFFPQIPSSSYVQTSGSWSGSLANQNFWEPIAACQPVCIKGRTLFVALLDPSGSFNNSQLPYKG